MIWKLNVSLDGSQITYEVVQTIEAKTHLTKVTSLTLKFVGVCDADGNTFIYEKQQQQQQTGSSGPYQLIQTFKHHKAMEAITMVEFFGDVLVACGGVDFSIHLYLLTGSKPVLVLKGHEDWIRSLSFKYIPVDRAIYLASASQDNRIRLWKIIKTSEKTIEKSSDSLLEEEMLVNLYNTFHFTSTNHYYQVTLDALLTGHEDWVHSLNWHPIPNMLQLVSTSMDRTMMIWMPSSNGGVWTNQYRMGEFGGLSGLFGQMGYYSGCFSMFGNYCMGTAFHGSFHLWKLKESENEWKPMVSISGHFNSVMDLDIEPSKDGIYFMTTSSDQTSRVFTWVDTIKQQQQSDASNYESNEDRSIREISRSQIHGYDMNCLSFTDYYSFASGGDEKVVRYFDAPQSFINTLSFLNSMGKRHYEQYGQGRDRVMAATVQPLGLTNKSVKEGEEKDMITVNEFDYQDQEEEEDVMEALGEASGKNSFNIFMNGSGGVLTHPPFETQLLQLTLWPEQQKIYGHANEIICVQSNNKKTILATACSAKQANVSQIRLWDIKAGFKPIDVIPGHNLTVSRIAFSNDDEWMCSVSRDRCMILYQKKTVTSTDSSVPSSFDTYEPFLYQQCHERIIWDVSFTADDKYVATGSRDNMIKVFKVPDLEKIKEINELKQTGQSNQFNLECVQTIEMPHPVTSIQFLPKVVYDEFADYFTKKGLSKYLMAIGMEDGSIQIYDSVLGESINLTNKFTVNDHDSHCDGVRRVKWRVDNSGSDIRLELVTCSLDFSVRLFEIIA